MTEHPILFSAEMVRAILEDRKTMTRRVIKPQPGPVRVALMKTSQAIEAWIGWNGKTATSIVKCPYGKIGDRLWVRETFASLQAGSYEHMKPHKQYSIIRYKADDSLATLNVDQRGYKYFPSIHMPRWASRITLEITDIRVERVREIRTLDCYAEGAPSHLALPGYWFKHLWDSINVTRGYGWDMNPWVWVVEFKRVEH